MDYITPTGWERDRALWDPIKVSLLRVASNKDLRAEGLSECSLLVFITSHALLIHINRLALSRYGAH